MVHRNAPLTETGRLCLAAVTSVAATTPELRGTRERGPGTEAAAEA
ncbi:hypothetical protein ABZZ79_30755 [Streptomyces sp. NPDC006458]